MMQDNDEDTPSTESATTADPYISLFTSTASRKIYQERVAILDTEDFLQWQTLSFPLEVGAELAAWCNLKCIMCPVPTTKRPRELMKPGLFKKITDELASESGYILLPQGFGETMLHAGWSDLVEYAQSKGIGPIVMLSNGTTINETNARKILRLGIDALVISIDGVKPETYASIRVGGKLQKVEANVKRLIDARGTDALPRLCLRIIRMKETESEIEEFVDRWAKLLRPDDLIQIQPFQDWAGKVDNPYTPKIPQEPQPPRRPCRMLWSNLSVHADGKVSACCHDSEDELIIGDVAGGETLQDIWRGEKLKILRNIHIEGHLEDLPICLACKAWK